MKRGHLTLAEQETIILWDNELDTASVYTHIRDEMLKKSTVNMGAVFKKREE